MLRMRWWALLLLVAVTTTGCSANTTRRPTNTPTSSRVTTPSPVPSTTASSIATATSTSAALPTPASSTVTAIPPVSASASAAGLVDIRTVVPDAILDLRYTTSNNFTGVILYPADARCLVHESMAPGLTVAAARLRAKGQLLVFWDCYRPHAVQVRMFQIVPDPNWVARPGPYATSHEAGRSVDVTLAGVAAGGPCAVDQVVQGHCRIDMGTDFDDFTARAHAFTTTGVSAAAQANRAELRAAMSAGGITVYSGEWWHFDGPGAAVKRPQLNAALD